MTAAAHRSLSFLTKEASGPTVGEGTGEGPAARGQPGTAMSGQLRIRSAISVS